MIHPSATMEIIAQLGILVAAVAVFLLLRLWRRPKLPPGPWGVPLLGSLPFADPNLHRYFADLAKTYGPIFSLRFGTKLYVVVSSPAMAAELFTTNDAIFSNHFVPCVPRSFFRDRTLLLMPHGPYWRAIRKMMVQEVLSHAAVSSFQPLRRREIQRVLAELRSGLGATVNLRDMVLSTLFNVLLVMLCGEVLDEDKGCSALRKQLLEIPAVLNETANFFNIADYFPVLAPLDLQGLNRKMAAASERADIVLDSIIERSLSTSMTGVRSFLQIMLDLAEKKDPEVPIGILEVKALAMEIVVVGPGTSATTVEWAMTELMRHPKVMAKLHEELDTVVGRGCAMEESHIPKLQYLSAILKETMRLYPAAPMLVPRYPSVTCEVGGYTIPKGSTVFVNAWAIQRDPSIWSEPLEFRPERFLENGDRWQFAGKSFEFMPFGVGRRICAGYNLAEKMMLYALGSLVHAFRWELPPGTVAVDVENRFGMMLQKKNALVLVPFTR